MISTLRENPQDAVIVSHRLMMRAGLIRKMGSGLYHLLPMGLRAFRKVENVIREEMNRSGALEFQLPILTPSDLWKKSQRWDSMGKEMFRLKDRHDNDAVLGPTHEESFTDLMKGVLQSYKDLPVNVYQIHTKFRDEIRPRFGVMRSREFVMKDAYSFDLNEESLDVTYQTMRKTYRNIFSRLGLRTVPVEADTGTMGGSASEEFMVPSEIGEETLLLSGGGKYRGNQEKTPVVYETLLELADIKKSKIEEFETPGITTIEALCDFAKCDAKETLKAVLYNVDGVVVAAFLRGDRDINEVKLGNVLNAGELVPASEEDIRGTAGTVPGYIGPQSLGPEVRILFDTSSLTRENWITGANKKDYHIKGYTLPQDAEIHDVSSAVAGDPSPAGDGVLTEMKGIEVGHIFKLGDKYTKAFELTILDDKGKAAIPKMGCYGIGVNRTLAAIIEQDSTDSNIRWSITSAPFEICLIGIAKKDHEVKKTEELYDAMLQAGLDVIWDDRDMRPGVKFADAELIGFPIVLTAGKTYFDEGKLEARFNYAEEKEYLSGDPSEIVDGILKRRADMIRELELKMNEFGGD